MSFYSSYVPLYGDGGNGGVAVNAGNINFGGSQTNTASADGGAGGLFGDGGNGGVAVNAGNINIGGSQTNTASADGGDASHFLLV
ncbi:hypothetical protein [Geodermatophilus sp. URMC 62]|uniref:hypothetical protein n=1 Tax=Geodermatophilus sp. URMC 62 TaxID=3423414 RepID=UPI00406D2F9B